ncbi:MAG: uracil-DNA glycosylase [Flavipsychrobacter sp.]
MGVQIEDSWKKELSEEFEQSYFKEIANFLRKEKAAGKLIFPPGKQIFNAFNTTTINNVKVVILGQDPYHNHGQAHGLSFSVQNGVAIPPSLVNIYKELHEDIGIAIPQHGNLEKWAKQGVLLLNASLTVEAHKPMSHSKIGWHQFTNKVIQILSERKEHLVFLLWGGFAKSKQPLIDKSKHLILTSAHPSPLSAYNGFFGCKHFSKTNNWLKEKGLDTIDWEL